MLNIILSKSAACIDLACFRQLPCQCYVSSVPNVYPGFSVEFSSVVAARFVTTARFVTKVTNRVKIDAQPARFVTPARFVITW